MTSIAAAIPAITSAVAVTVGRSFEDRIEPTALKADADKSPSGKQGDKAKHDQNNGPVHTTSRTIRAMRVAQEYGPLVAPQTESFA